MSTIIWIAIGATIGIASPWIILSLRHSITELPSDSIAPAPRHKARISSKPKPESFEGVTISLCAESCAAAVSQQGHRYLSVDAPELPLPGCDARKCNCRYQRHADRRDVEDRRLGLGRFRDINSQSGDNERRSAENHDRRRTPSADSSQPSAYFNDY